jgi:phosphoribosyl 1,2-cyclic phosphodiesterase
MIKTYGFCFGYLSILIMKIKLYGTRGSVPVFNPRSVKYGGNTTCLRILTDQISSNQALVIDAGSGFIPMGNDLLKETNGKLTETTLLFTHWHNDHTLGLFLSPITYFKSVKMKLMGPSENNVGPKEMMEDMMRPPYFPIDVREVRSKFEYINIDMPQAQVILIHKKGTRLVDLDVYEKIETNMEPIEIEDEFYPLNEFLVVKMHRAKHPDKTISYRFENKRTGKVFVFLTDNENEDGFSGHLKKHVQDADLLIMDAQYSREKYISHTVGYGHGTPDYAVKLAEYCNVKRLGLTHHDPTSEDTDVDNIMEEGKKALSPNSKLEVFACADYMTVSV